MPITYRRPGVYLEESLLVNSSDTASTYTVACFIGVAEKGPINEPTRADSWSDYVTVFGGFNPITPPPPDDPNDVTTATFGTDPIPANLTALKADPEHGDSGTAKPTADFTNGQYVKLGDNSKANWAGSAWTVGARSGGTGTPAPMPPVTKVQSYLPFAVYSYFQSGGRAAWIIRATPTSVEDQGISASIVVNGGNPAGDPLTSFRLLGLSAGTWGNKLKYNLSRQSTVGTAPDADDVFAIQIFDHQLGGLRRSGGDVLRAVAQG